MPATAGHAPGGTALQEPGPPLLAPAPPGSGRGSRPHAEPAGAEGLSASLRRHLRCLSVTGPLPALEEVCALCHQWLRPEARPKEQTLEQLVLEQFQGALPEAVQTWVPSRHPQSRKEAGALVAHLICKCEEEGVPARAPALAEEDAAAGKRPGKADAADHPPAAEAQPLVTFEDVLVDLSPEERGLLSAAQRRLFREVTLDNYRTLVSLGHSFPKPALVSQLEAEESQEAAEGGAPPASTAAAAPPSRASGPAPAGAEEAAAAGGGRAREGGARAGGARESPVGAVTVSDPAPRPRDGPREAGEEGRPAPAEQRAGPPRTAPAAAARPGPPPPDGQARPPPAAPKAGAALPGAAPRAGPRLIRYWRARADGALQAWRCCDCGRAFGGRAQLLQHCRVHARERPYPCRLCGRCFGGPWPLTRHYQLHSREGR